MSGILFLASSLLFGGTLIALRLITFAPPMQEIACDTADRGHYASRKRLLKVCAITYKSNEQGYCHQGTYLPHDADSVLTYDGT